jgi:hypothetical protein
MIETETFILKMKSVSLWRKKNIYLTDYQKYFEFVRFNIHFEHEINWDLAKFFDTKKQWMCMAVISYLYSFSFDNPELVEILESIVT